MNLQNINNYKLLINCILFLFPVSFIIGNFAINFLSILTILIFLFNVKKNYNFKNKIFILLSLFFFLIILSTIYSFFYNSINNILNSIFFLRYFLFLVAITFLLTEIKYDLKYFFISCLLCGVALSLDIIYQYFNGQDIFGFKSLKYHNSGFLGKELIAGSFLQRFLLIGIFYVPIFFREKNNFLIFPLLLIGSLAIVLSGNRMSAVMFILFLGLSFIIFKKIRVQFLLVLFFSIVINSFIINNDLNLKKYQVSFFNNAGNVVKHISKQFGVDYSELEQNKNEPFHHGYEKDDLKKKFEMVAFGSGHSIIFITAIDTWLDSPIIGSGIKSFRINCRNKIHLPNRHCEQHEHNYYLSILNTVGIVGFILILIIIFFLIKENLIIKIKQNSIKEYFYINAISINLIIEFFPFKSSGNFFSTYNSTYIFFLIGILISYFIKKNFTNH